MSLSTEKFAMWIDDGSNRWTWRYPATDRWNGTLDFGMQMPLTAYSLIGQRSSLHFLWNKGDLIYFYVSSQQTMVITSYSEENEHK